jgi:PAS domain S-box-containing protein
MASPEGFSGLFWTAFRRSRNAMLLLDDERGIVDVNAAFLGLLGYTREQLVGHPVREFVVGGPILTPEEWEARMSLGDFTGEGELIASDGTEVSVQLAAHTEVVTGRRLVLFVTLSTSRWGRHFRRETRPIEPSETLSPRELDVVRLIAMGGTGREIANELHISPDTVRTHVRNAMRKVGARSRAQLVAKVLAEGHALN